MSPDFGVTRLGVVGAGLLGTSFALASKAAFAGIEVVGFDRKPEALAQATRQGALDHVAGSLAELATGCGLILIATPVDALESVFAGLAGHLDSSSWIMDVTSTKSSSLALARRHLGAALARFVPAHPIAGGTASGPEHARADLFLNRAVILTPMDETQDAGVTRMTQYWQALGARPCVMRADAHDALYAYLSHVPHLVAFAYMQSADPEARQHLDLAGPGFRDFTRIAKADAVLWAGILRDNRAAIAPVVAALQDQLGQLARCLQHDDALALEDYLRRSAAMRQELS